MDSNSEEELLPAVINGTMVPMSLSEAMAVQSGVANPDRVGWYPTPGTASGFSPAQTPPPSSAVVNVDARSIHHGLVVNPGASQVKAEAERRHSEEIAVQAAQGGEEASGNREPGRISAQSYYECCSPEFC